MKKLISTLAITGILFTLNANAEQTGSASQVAEALVKQQNQQVSTQIVNQVSQDIKFALRAMVEPKLHIDQNMTANVDTKKVNTPRGE